MLLPSKSCAFTRAFSAKNNQVQRPNILCWIFTLRTSVTHVIGAGHSRYHSIKIAVLMVLIIYLLAGCIGSSDISGKRSYIARQEGQKIKIGLIWPFELYKDFVAEGVQLAVDKVNQAGGILDRQVELVIKDDEANVNTGLLIAEEFSEDPEVMAVIGHCNSYVSLAVALTYETSELIMFSPSSTSPELTQKGYKYIFRNVPTDNLIGSRAAQLCLDKGYEKAVICYADNTYGLSLANAFEKEARRLDFKIVDRFSYNAGDASEFEYILDKWKVYDFDVIFFAGMIDAGLVLISKARAEGYRQAIIGSDGLDSLSLLTLDQKASEGVYIIAMYNPYSTRQEALDFNETFIKKYNKDPDSWAALSYDAVDIIFEAMRRADSVDPKKVAPEIGMIQEFVGVTGRHTFNKNGDVKEKSLALKFIYEDEFKYLDLD